MQESCNKSRARLIKINNSDSKNIFFLFINNIFILDLKLLSDIKYHV
jgi:hypothetical protein